MVKFLNFERIVFEKSSFSFFFFFGKFENPIFGMFEPSYLLNYSSYKVLLPLVLIVLRWSFCYTKYQKSILCTVFFKKQMTHFRKFKLFFLKIYIFFNKNKTIQVVYKIFFTDIIPMHPNNLLKFHNPIFNSFWILKV